MDAASTSAPSPASLAGHDVAMPSPAPPLLTSLSNPRVTAAARLRDRRDRERTGLTLIDGARELRRALDRGIDVTEVFVCEPLLAGPDARTALDALHDRGATILPTTQAVFAKLAFGERAEGLVAVARIPSTDLASLAIPDEALVVVLEAVEKPGNLGAVLRSADGAGADAVILADPRTDPFNPNAVRASIGTIFAMRLAAAPSEQALEWLNRQGIRILAARVDADVDYPEVDLR